MAECPLNQYRDELAICSPCENICARGIPFDRCASEAKCENLYYDLIKERCVAGKIYDRFLDLCEECVASGCYEGTSVYTQGLCDFVCPKTTAATKPYGILPAKSTTTPNYNGTLLPPQGYVMSSEIILTIAVLISLAVIIIIVIICIICIYKIRRKKSGSQQQDTFTQRMAMLPKIDTDSENQPQSGNDYESVPQPLQSSDTQQPVSVHSTARPPSTRSSSQSNTAIILSSASRRPSNNKFAFGNEAKTARGETVSQESQHNGRSKISFMSAVSNRGNIYNTSTPSDTLIKQVDFMFEPFLLVTEPESQKLDQLPATDHSFSLKSSLSPVKSHMDTTAKLKPSENVREVPSYQNTKSPSKRLSDVRNGKNDKPVTNETFPSKNAHGDPPEKAPLYNGYDKSPPVSKSNVRDSRQASDFDPYYSPYRNNGPVQHTDPHNNSGYSSGYHLNGDDLQNSESPRSLYNFKEDDPYKDRLDQMFSGPPSPKLPSVKQELTTEEEVRNLPIGLPVIPNVREKFGVLKEFTWIKRVVSNGKYFLIKYDSIDRASAEKLILEKVGLVQNQYKLVSE